MRVSIADLLQPGVADHTLDRRSGQDETRRVIERIEGRPKPQLQIAHHMLGQQIEHAKLKQRLLWLILLVICWPLAVMPCSA